MQGLRKRKEIWLLALVLIGFVALVMVARSGGGDPPDSSTGKALPSKPFRLRADGRKIGFSIQGADMTVPVRRDATVGYVDNVISEGNAIGLTGWAVTGDLTRPADAIVGFVGRKAVGAVKPAGERPDVAKYYSDPSLTNSGFVLRVPSRSLDCAVRADGLGVFAATRKAATPLQWLGDVGRKIDAACRRDRALRATARH